MQAPSRFLFFKNTATTEIHTLSLHDALPIWHRHQNEQGWLSNSLPCASPLLPRAQRAAFPVGRSEEHTSELQSQSKLVCRLLLEKKKPESDWNISKEFDASTSLFFVQNYALH